jgi:hypothetical protein
MPVSGLPGLCSGNACLALAQDVQMGDMRMRQRCSEVLLAYHPFWLRAGLEAVLGRAAPKQAAGQAGRAALDAFVREHFLGDPDLAAQRAGNRATGGLHSAAYWVRSPAVHSSPCQSACSTGGRRNHSIAWHVPSQLQAEERFTTWQHDKHPLMGCEPVYINHAACHAEAWLCLNRWSWATWC